MLEVNQSDPQLARSWALLQVVWLFIIPFWVNGQDFPFRGDWDLSIGEILMKSLGFSSKLPAFQTMRFISVLYHHWYFKISRAFSVIFSFKAEVVKTIMLSLQTCLASTNTIVLGEQIRCFSLIQWTLLHFPPFWKADSLKETLRKRCTTFWFTPQIPTVTMAGPGWRQEPRTQSRSPMWVVGTQILEQLPAVPQGAYQQ